MRKLSLTAILLLVIGVATGCGNANSASNTNGNQNPAGQSRQQMMQSPEGNLARTIMQITRIQRSDTPFSKDQSQKLTAILNDIKTKDSIDEAYASQEISAINSIMTEQQKQILSSAPGNFNRNQNNGSQNFNGNAQQSGTPDNNGQQIGQRRRGGQQSGQGTQNGGFGGNRNGFDLKSICDRAIISLQGQNN